MLHNRVSSICLILGHKAIEKGQAHLLPSRLDQRKPNNRLTSMSAKEKIEQSQGYKYYCNNQLDPID